MLCLLAPRHVGMVGALVLFVSSNCLPEKVNQSDNHLGPRREVFTKPGQNFEPLISMERQLRSEM